MAGNFMSGVQGFLTGLAGVANTVGGIVDTGANAAEDIARGKGALADQKLDVKEREQDMWLKQTKVERGDNVVLYWAIAFAAVLGVVVIAR